MKRWLSGLVSLCLVSQTGWSAIVFDFTYGDGGDFWGPDARAALNSAAQSLASYFPGVSTTLTFAVTGESNNNGVLASAGSDLISGAPGFFRTIVQNKIISGVDSNGADPDGDIHWNFHHSWDYDDMVSPSAYDFKSTAMHELLHTLGFLSLTDAPGNNTQTTWSAFDAFLTDQNGLSPIDATTFAWNPAFDPILTGGSSDGLFFSGPNAMAAYGGQRVPLYSPNPWEQGSSASHLDDNTFVAPHEMLMNAASPTGPGIRTLSLIELGILADLAYAVVPEPSALALAAVAFIGLGLVRRLKIKD